MNGKHCVIGRMNLPLFLQGVACSSQMCVTVTPTAISTVALAMSCNAMQSKVR